MSEQNKKLQITGVRLRMDERKKLEKAAKMKNQNLSRWMRETLVSSADEQLNTGL